MSKQGAKILIILVVLGIIVTVAILYIQNERKKKEAEAQNQPKEVTKIEKGVDFAGIGGLLGGIIGIKK